MGHEDCPNGNPEGPLRERREINVMGVLVTPASVCLRVDIARCIALRRLLNLLDVDRLVWHRASFHLALTVIITSNLILSLRFGGH
jgi:Protein of unknown function (DUF1656)